MRVIFLCAQGFALVYLLVESVVILVACFILQLIILDEFTGEFYSNHLHRWGFTADGMSCAQFSLINWLEMLRRYGQSVVEGLTGLEGAGVFHGPCSILHGYVNGPYDFFFNRSLMHSLEWTGLFL